MRLTFVAHFIISLACLGAAFFAWSAGAPQAVWDSGTAGWYALAIGIVVVSAAIWVGWQAWLADEPPTYLGLDRYGERIDGRATVDSSFGHYAGMACPCIGTLGTVLALSEAFAHGGDQVAILQYGHTAFYSTGCGILGLLICMTVTHNLEAGMRRLKR